MKIKGRNWGLVTATIVIAMMSGCSTLGAKPWQRGTLARDDMRLGGNALDSSLDDHLYFSREASSGGRGFAGGGCGCN
jgi:hypothetical protein